MQISRDQCCVRGTVDDYSFSAKHFNEGSQMGINGGRVSKLDIWESDNKNNMFVHYDRGWDVKPRTTEQKRVLSEVLECLEQLPKIVIDEDF